ncbi:BON domain-containing protein [Novosphingobium sp. KACC 22771]|uniref:BON domain-containing protein n=1 Tax=Novosphingobium sp. KACC 22771 TaxID=3025670 RepID=UPI0023671449|nr:BON domain-containing protein [Novosphingobium sp. KACC 22771]WDF72503.1 BON domain-containing protein [Novosphingobium sp. KACC 22771]
MTIATIKPTDRQLQESVLAEFAWEPSINAAHIGVAVEKGVVSLSGHVSTYGEKSAAERAARRVRGVLGIAEAIEVHMPVETERSDEAIAHAAIERLAWEASIPTNALQIKVEQGWITLTGELGWHYQRMAAERMLTGLRGVAGISNLVTIRKRPNGANISHDISTALHRGWFDPSSIEVAVSANTVTLTGTVDTPADKWKAGLTAWAGAGVAQVDNNLVVLAQG